MDLLPKLLQRHADFSSVVIDQEEAVRYQADFAVLVTMGILERVSDPQHVWCRTCNNESVEVHFVSEGRAYTLCSQDESASRDYFDPSEIKQWRFNIKQFLLLYANALGLQPESVNENLAQLVWNIGAQEINGVTYNVFFCRDINAITTPDLSIFTANPNTVILHTGVVHSHLPEGVLLVPVVELIGEVNGEIVLKKELIDQYFLSDVFTTKNGDLLLDDTIVLQGDYLLYEPKRGSVYGKRSEKMRPLGARIINHLYGIRKYGDNAKTLKELSEALGSNSTSSVSNEIKRVQDLCTAIGVMPILVKFADDKWGVNQQLKCCK